MNFRDFFSKIYTLINKKYYMEEQHHNNNMSGGGKKVSDNTAMAIIAYILFFVPLLTDAKDDPFVKYHVKQGLIVFIIGVGAAVLAPVLLFLTLFIHLFVLVLAILGIINVLNGKKEPLPLVGEFAAKFKF